MNNPYSSSISQGPFMGSRLPNQGRSSSKFEQNPAVANSVGHALSNRKRVSDPHVDAPIHHKQLRFDADHPPNTSAFAPNFTFPAFNFYGPSGFAPSFAPPAPKFNGSGNPSRNQQSTKARIFQLEQELAMLDGNGSSSYLVNTRRLIVEELENLKNNVSIQWINFDSPKTFIKLKMRVILPRSRPGFNIPGRLLGKGGSTSKKICQTYRCALGIYGAGSSKDTSKEMQMLQSGNPSYAHLSLPLHAEISINGEPSEVYERLSKLLNLIHRVIKMTETIEQDGICIEATNLAPNPNLTEQRQDQGQHFHEPRQDQGQNPHQSQSLDQGDFRGGEESDHASKSPFVQYHDPYA